MYVLVFDISTTLLVLIPVNPGGLVPVQAKELICMSRIILPIIIPFLYSDTFMAKTLVIIFGGVTQRFPVIGSNVDPPPTGFVMEYGAI